MSPEPARPANGRPLRSDGHVSWTLTSPVPARDADEVMSWHTETDVKGRLLDGRHAYLLRFEPDQEPPARGFWSMAMYDPRGIPVDNRLHRFSIGDRNGLEFNRDGSLEIAVRHESPGRARETNWLPAPEALFFVRLHVYGPQPRAVSGAWQPPPLLRLEGPGMRIL